MNLAAAHKRKKMDLSVKMAILALAQLVVMVLLSWAAFTGHFTHTTGSRVGGYLFACFAIIDAVAIVFLLVTSIRSKT